MVDVTKMLSVHVMLQQMCVNARAKVVLPTLIMTRTLFVLVSTMRAELIKRANMRRTFSFFRQLSRQKWWM